jgi:hypothetical protein
LKLLGLFLNSFQQSKNATLHLSILLIDLPKEFLVNLDAGLGDALIGMVLEAGERVLKPDDWSLERGGPVRKSGPETASAAAGGVGMWYLT